MEVASEIECRADHAPEKEATLAATLDAAAGRRPLQALCCGAADCADLLQPDEGIGQHHRYN